MAQRKCMTCDGTGWDSAMRRSGLPPDTPAIFQPFGVWRCPSCGGSGLVGFTDEQEAAICKAAQDAIDSGKINIKGWPKEDKT